MYTKEQIEKLRANLQDRRDAATKSLKILEEIDTKEGLAKLMQMHMTAGVLEHINPEMMSHEAVAMMTDAANLVLMFLEWYPATTDIPTIAHNMSVARYEYLKDLFQAYEDDINRLEKELVNASAN